MFKKTGKKIAALVPGTGANLAQKKRAFERELRKQGFSRSLALTMASQHFAREKTNLDKQ